MSNILNIYNVPLTHSHQQKAHNFWWSQICFAVFLWTGGRGQKPKSLWLNWAVFCEFYKSTGPNGPDLSERESINSFFQGQSVLMCIMALPWAHTISTFPCGKRNDIICSKETKSIHITRSFIWLKWEITCNSMTCRSWCWYLICLSLFWEDEKWIIEMT